MSSASGVSTAVKACPTEPVAPKRERGRLRVRAILDAAAALLAEKGYEATTMSEVAVRSRTAIGSLYRFFPTKPALAEALSQRFVAEVGLRLEAVEAHAAAMDPAGLADALLGMMVELRQDRAAVIALLEKVGDGGARRSALRADMIHRLDGILRAFAGGESGDVVPSVFVILHLMKGVSRLDEMPDEAAYLSALRRTMSLYLAGLLAERTVGGRSSS